MQRARQVASLVCAGAGLLLAFAGSDLGLVGQYGPGVGFFPFAIGVLLALLSVAWSVQLMREPSPKREPFWVDRNGRGRVAIVVASLAVFTVLLEPLGFRLTMLGVLLLLLLGFSRERFTIKIVLSLAGSFGTYYVFENLLRVPLPSGSIGFLRVLGL